MLLKYYSVLEIEKLLNEVQSYGKDGKSFLSSICPNFVRYFYKLRNKIYNFKNIIKRKFLNMEFYKILISTRKEIWNWIKQTIKNCKNTNWRWCLTSTLLGIIVYKLFL